MKKKEFSPGYGDPGVPMSNTLVLESWLNKFWSEQEQSHNSVRNVYFMYSK